MSLDYGAVSDGTSHPTNMNLDFTDHILPVSSSLLVSTLHDIDCLSSDAKINIVSLRSRQITATSLPTWLSALEKVNSTHCLELRQACSLRCSSSIYHSQASSISAKTAWLMPASLRCVTFSSSTQIAVHRSSSGRTESVCSIVCWVLWHICGFRCSWRRVVGIVASTKPPAYAESF